MQESHQRQYYNNVKLNQSKRLKINDAQWAIREKKRQTGQTKK